MDFRAQTGIAALASYVAPALTLLSCVLDAHFGPAGARLHDLANYRFSDFTIPHKSSTRLRPSEPTYAPALPVMKDANAS